ncbi:trypsin alpha-like [Schistocerca gregaria]|uniref:trypsin alpha-like n=1 Tax=Schistocerca gregaria TaxID=7010 RepID=UPI00211EF28D|nr:trypsin alpha-like [Schistocerca gregaria]
MTSLRLIAFCGSLQPLLLLLLCTVAATAAYEPEDVEEERVLGQNASLSSFPWQATVEFSGSPRCSGSILTPTMVLTAAHCTIEGIAQYITVRVGTSALNSGGDVYQADAIYIHQNYKMFSEDYDVSLLPLTSEIALEEGRVEVIPLPGNETLPPALGAVLNVTGWSTENGTSADTLQMSQMVVVNSTECVDGQGGNLTERMLCVAPLDGSICKGDDGGPAVIDGVQFGIVSVAPYSCDTNTVLVNLAEYYVRDWIRYFSGV